MALIAKITLSIIFLTMFLYSCTLQKGLFLVHISKSVLKALYYKAFSTFLPTIWSYMQNFKR